MIRLRRVDGAASRASSLRWTATSLTRVCRPRGKTVCAPRTRARVPWLIPPIGAMALTMRVCWPTCPRTPRLARRSEVARSAAFPGTVRVSVPGGGGPRGELSSAHGGHEIEASAAHHRGALAHNPSHHAPQSPLIRARTRYVESGPSHPHVGLLFRAWATPPACGIGGSRAGQAARVQNQVE